MNNTQQLRQEFGRTTMGTIQDTESLGLKNIRDSIQLANNSTLLDRHAATSPRAYDNKKSRISNSISPSNVSKLSNILNNQNNGLHEKVLDKYMMENLAEFTDGKLDLKTQFSSPKVYKTSPRTEILAMPKNQYHGKDFF